MRFLILTILVFVYSDICIAGKIALSFDDAPRPVTPLLGDKNRADVLIQELKSVDVTEAMFFVTTSGLSKNSETGAIEKYDQAGFYIANHTHSHPRPDDVGIANYVKDIQKADKILKKYSNFLPFFRYPYLDYGKTVQTRDKLRNYLKDMNYTNGYVTVDNYDWYIDHAVQKALKAGKKVNLQKLKKAYIYALWDSIQFYDKLSQKVLGRSVAHVLLLHENDLAALFVGDLVEFLRSKGWEIISPLEAYKDLISSLEPNTLRNNNGRIAAIATALGYKGVTRDYYQSSEAVDELLKERGIIEP